MSNVDDSDVMALTALIKMWPIWCICQSHSRKSTAFLSRDCNLFIAIAILCYVQDAHNLLRPETVESLLILKIVTEKSHYQEWAWEIFRAFHMHSIVESGGYANLNSCLEVCCPHLQSYPDLLLIMFFKFFTASY